MCRLYLKATFKSFFIIISNSQIAPDAPDDANHHLSPPEPCEPVSLCISLLQSIFLFVYWDAEKACDG